MPRRRAIKSVLSNFHGTYTSRYSEYDGYWLFGFVFAEINELTFELLGKDAREADDPFGKANYLAVTRFNDQLLKARLLPTQVKRAWLKIEKLPGSVRGLVNDQVCDGFNVCFGAGAEMDDGKRYERRKTVFVVPHDAKNERQSARAITP